ncbi:hypothetical protein [Arthrobacter sp. NPDC058192]|uniref:hypothetical protein n=1 Tax=Arthrobacter sp. NPDC058192 TaxID=3346372 RepID=UPI0036DFF293
MNKQKLADIKAIGGDTVITFGSQLKPATLASLPPDCLVNGVNCAQAAAGTVKVNRYFTYRDRGRWGAPAVKCPLDRSLTSNGKAYTVLVFPARGAGCTSSDGAYDVVVVGGGSATAGDPSVSLAAAATSLGVKYFAGLPLPVHRTDLPYLPDLSYLRTFTQFTERYLQYQAAVNNVPGLAGFYHTTEMPTSDGATFDSVLTTYRVQNDAIRRIMPTRAAVVSPYLDSRVQGGNISLEMTRNGVRKIAQTAGGIVLNIAVQDGMGTGKGGAYFGHEAGAAVDRFAAVVVGSGSWGRKYAASNRDYFLAAAAGVSGTGAVLWANLEGMAPAAGTNPCAGNLRGQTTKARIDRQLQQLANAPSKIISFMWDSYYTCRGTGTPLKTQVAAGKTTPVITDTTFRPASGKVQITGFNLTGGSVQVTWTTAANRVLKKSVSVAVTNTAYGRQAGLNPRLEMITVKVGPTTLGTGKFYMVNVTNGWGAKNDAPYSKRG